MKHKLWKCVSCGNLFLWRNQGHNIELKNCPHCTLDEWIECTDPQIVPVAQPDKGCDCDMIARILKKQKAEAEAEEKSCRECSHRYTIMGCQEERNEIEDICLLTGESNPTKRCENYALKLKKQKAEPEPQEPINNMMFFTTEWAMMVTKHEQQITANNTRLDALEDIRKSLQGLIDELSERIGLMEISDNGYNSLKAQLDKLEGGGK